MKRRPKQRVTVNYPSGRLPQLTYKNAAGGWERVSAGSADPDKVEEARAELEARLVLGMVERKRKNVGQMTWETFVIEYTSKHLRTLKPKARVSAESRLQVVETIAKPEFLIDMTDRDRLESLVTGLRAGVGRKEKNKPRSAYTVRGTLTQLLSALRWACRRGWIPAVPMLEPVRVAKIRSMRGRAITSEEFEKIVKVVPKVLKRDAGTELVQSWEWTLKGLWASGLRLSELMSLSWDDHCEIVPYLGRLPTMAIPSDRQKNSTEESIPLLPEFAALLRTVPEDQRTGWIFAPGLRKHRHGAKRPRTDWVGKVVGACGRAAGVVVLKAPEKFASSHDLRRSAAQRMIEAGVSMYTVQAVMRHADFKTTQKHYGGMTVERAALELQERMPTKPIRKPSHTVRR